MLKAFGISSQISEIRGNCIFRQREILHQITVISFISI